MLGAQQQKRIESIRLELDYCLHKMNDVDSVGRGTLISIQLVYLRILVTKMEVGDIPGLLSSGLLDSDKMRPMGRRFSVKVVEYIVEHFGSGQTLPYLTAIMTFLIQGCSDTEVHVQNSAVCTIGLIAKFYLTEEIFQLNQDVIDCFFDPIMLFARKETNPSIQVSAIAAISSAIDGMSINLAIMNLSKLTGSLVPIMMNPNTCEACRAVVIDTLRKVVVLVWTFLQETPFGSSPTMYELKRTTTGNEDSNNSGEFPDFEQNKSFESHLTPPISWKQICNIINGILKEIHPNFTTHSKSVNVRSASLSLLTEIMVCCFVAQAGALLAAHSSNIPLQKSIDGIKTYAKIIINVVTLGSRDKSPKVREVAQYCLKRLQEANETYIPESSDLMILTKNVQIAEKEQYNTQNAPSSTKLRSRIINEDFFKNATDEIIIKYVSPPSNWRKTELSDNSEQSQFRLASTRSIEDQADEDLCSASIGSATETQSLHSNINSTLSANETLSQTTNLKLQEHSQPTHPEKNPNYSLMATNFTSIGLSNTSTPLPSPLYVVAQPPIIQGQMLNYPGMTQESNEKQLILEKKVEELSKEVSRLNSKQLELENVAHVLKMVAIHRVDSLEEKIKNLSSSLGETKSEKELNEILDEKKKIEELASLSVQTRKELVEDARRELYNKAKQVVVEQKLGNLKLL
ncbi:HEAT repeat family protein [Cryptosporidium felis]|nr:HEAT repeat family protein [Cryptosporidium felis]